MSILDGMEDFMLDTFTLATTTPGPQNALTGAATGPATETVVVSQPCCDQDANMRIRSRSILDGVAGGLPLSGVYTRWFPWPVPPAGGQLVARVNGQYRQLLRQGAPINIGGQRDVYFIQLGAAEANR